MPVNSSLLKAFADAVQQETRDQPWHNSVFYKTALQFGNDGEPDLVAVPLVDYGDDAVAWREATHDLVHFVDRLIVRGDRVVEDYKRQLVFLKDDMETKERALEALNSKISELRYYVDRSVAGGPAHGTSIPHKSSASCPTCAKRQAQKELDKAFGLDDPQGMAAKLKIMERKYIKVKVENQMLKKRLGLADEEDQEDGSMLDELHDGLKSAKDKTVNIGVMLSELRKQVANHGVEVHNSLRELEVRLLAKLENIKLAQLVSKRPAPAKTSVGPAEAAEAPVKQGSKKHKTRSRHKSHRGSASMTSSAVDAPLEVYDGITLVESSANLLEPLESEEYASSGPPTGVSTRRTSEGVEEVPQPRVLRAGDLPTYNPPSTASSDEEYYTQSQSQKSKSVKPSQPRGAKGDSCTTRPTLRVQQHRPGPQHVVAAAARRHSPPPKGRRPKEVAHHAGNHFQTVTPDVPTDPDDALLATDSINDLLLETLVSIPKSTEGVQEIKKRFATLAKQNARVSFDRVAKAVRDKRLNAALGREKAAAIKQLLYAQRDRNIEKLAQDIRQRKVQLVRQTQRLKAKVFDIGAIGKRSVVEEQPGPHIAGQPAKFRQVETGLAGGFLPVLAKQEHRKGTSFRTPHTARR